jgi:hypothetical protein
MLVRGLDWAGCFCRSYAGIREFGSTLKMYEAPRTTLIVAILGALVFGWLGISGLIQGADIWKPVLALAFAVAWLVVGLTMWRRNKAKLRNRNASSA